MPPRRIVLGSRNPGKLREMRAILADLPVELVGLEQLDPQQSTPEPEEIGETFADNARAKALYYAAATGQWALADDSGLVVDALGGVPGVRSARFAAEDVPPGAPRNVIDSANNVKLLRLLADVPDARRTARFVCHLVLAEGGRVILESHGAVEGRILHEPRGRGGFGYDPLFFVEQAGCTTAELPEERKNAISHRGQAARQLAAALRKLLAMREE
jgi:XTP/dITP diphosphohydrolase